MNSTAKPRVAVVGSSHWHHKFYRETIAREGQVVAYSDPSPDKLTEVRGLYGDVGRPDWHELLDDRLALDGVVVLAPHDEMKDVCLAFIARKIPVILEKPGGISAGEVGEIRAAAEAGQVPVAVAFIQRAGHLWRHMQKVGTLDYATFLFQSGPPERYINQSPWALRREHAGGGCFINLGVHYIDLFLAATGAPSVTVQAQAQYRLSPAYTVEDQLTALITTEQGVSATVQVGYAFPASPDVRYLAYSARGADAFLAIDRSGDIAMTSTATGETAVINEDVDSNPLTGIFIHDAVTGIKTGFPGLPGIADLHRAMQVVDAAYASAATGTAVTASITW